MRLLISSILMLVSIHATAEKPVEFFSEHIIPPEDFHNHSSSIVETSRVDLIVCWFHGKGERTDDTVIIQGARKREGETKWSKPFLMADTQDLPDQNPTLFIDPDERLWMFWTSSIDNEVRSFLLKYRQSTNYHHDGPPIWDWQDVMLTRAPEAESAYTELLDSRIEKIQAGENIDPEWKALFLKHAEERRHMYGDKLFQRIGWLPRLPPIMLSDKRMMLGIYSDTFDTSMFAFTNNAGETWEYSRPLEPFGIQPAIVQKNDGTLVAYMRSVPLTTCVESSDGGKTWTERSLDIANSGSSVAVLRLASGNWILAVNDIPDGRKRLSLYWSDNEGETWTRKRLLENMDPERGYGTASYPTLIQTNNGMIHITYTLANSNDFKGKTIKHAWFTEKWLIDGKAHRE